MDLAKTLVRSVARAFYETRHILVIDAVVVHSALRDDDLAYLMSMNIKDLHKLCAKLKEDRLLIVHSRAEIREGQQRPNSRTYYYIDYRQAIDAIKWRVYKIDKDMQGPVVPPSEKKEYFCDRCKAEWTQMEVLDNVGPSGFLCHRCGYVLRHGEAGQSAGHEKSTRMHNQFKFITELLPKIDSVVVPDNNFDTAFANRRVVERDHTHQAASSQSFEGGSRPAAVRGLANTAPNKMSVSIQDSIGPTEEEKAAERARKEKIAKQNALPSWMSNSTITGEAYKLEAPAGGREGGAAAKAGGAGTKTGAGAAEAKAAAATPATSATAVKDEPDVKNPAITASDAKEDAAIDDYFERLKQQAAAEAQRMKQEEDDDEEEEEEDEDDEMFEDVVATPPVAGGLQAAATATTPAVPSPLRQSSLKREVSPSGGGKDSPGSEDRPAKKVKVEEPSQPAAGGTGTGTGTGAGAGAGAGAGEESEEEDVEFEDAM